MWYFQTRGSAPWQLQRGRPLNAARNIAFGELQNCAVLAVCFVVHEEADRGTDGTTRKPRIGKGFYRNDIVECSPGSIDPRKGRVAGLDQDCVRSVGGVIGHDCIVDPNGVPAALLGR